MKKYNKKMSYTLAALSIMSSNAINTKAEKAIVERSQLEIQKKETSNLSKVAAALGIGVVGISAFNFINNKNAPAPKLDDKFKDEFNIEYKNIFTSDEYDYICKTFSVAFDNNSDIAWMFEPMEELDGTKKLKRGYFIELKRDNEPVVFSFFNVSKNLNNIWVDELWTVPSYKGKGYGKRMLLYLLKLSSENNLALRLLSRSTKEAKEFYKKFMNPEREEVEGIALNFDSDVEHSKKVLSAQKNQELLNSIKNLNEQLIKV